MVRSLLSALRTKDKTCRLTPRDYALLSHDSVIHYKGAMFADLAVLEAKLQQNVIRLKPRISERNLSRVRAGFAASEHALPLFEKVLRDQGLITD